MASKKKVGIGVAAIAAGAGAVIAVKNHKNADKKSAGKRAGTTVIQREGMMKKTARESTTQTEIMKLLQDQGNRKV